MHSILALEPPGRRTPRNKEHTGNCITFPLSFFPTGLQSVLHYKPQPTGSILGVADGGQQRANDHLGTNAARNLHHPGAGVHFDGGRSNVQPGTGQNAAR